MPPRIITLTMNPAVDYLASAEHIRPVHKVRTEGNTMSPGGGGINVARVVRELGGEATALLLAGGPTGAMLEAMLASEGLPHHTVQTAGATRLCVTAIEQSSGLEYRLVPPGPTVTPAEWAEMLEEVAATPGDWLVASGSLPAGVPVGFYAELARQHDRLLALDTSGPALRAALCGDHPPGIDLAKLSLGELESLAGHDLADPTEQEAAALELVHSGAARLVAVTLGGDGAFLASKRGVHRLAAPEVPVVSAVGAGDAFLAAMVLALSEGHAPEEALAAGVATGSAVVAAGGISALRADEVRRWQGAMHLGCALPHLA